MIHGGKRANFSLSYKEKSHDQNHEDRCRYRSGARFAGRSKRQVNGASRVRGRMLRIAVVSSWFALPDSTQLNPNTGAL